ncbi:MAG TPA: hypothetical protein VFS00_08815 [Polyangiaceae bacterium]|nr:hypothetical protein [Polyangiaceae bacterium]
MTSPPGADHGRLGRVARQGLLTAALLAATYHLATIFNAHYPVREWLFWHYLRCWAHALAFGLACLSSGRLVVRALTRAEGPTTGEQWALGFATGALAFGLALFGVGLAGGLNAVAFYAVPGALFAVGAPGLARELRAALRSRGESVGRAPTPGWALLCAAAAALGLALVYLPLLSPESLAYDSRWYHLGLAEHYVAAGRVAPLPEGPISATIPHLATFFYAWALLWPDVAYFDQIELALHVEFVIFLATLASVPPLVRRLAPGARAGFSWLWIFAFPGIFVYDGVLAGDADHVVALWAVPLYLAFLRAVATLSPRDCALLALQMSGVILTKYTAVTLLVFPTLAIVARALWAAAAPRRAVPRPGDWLKGPLTALALGLAFTAPHWLKNWLWYGDPVYPMLYPRLASRPWTPDSAHWYATFKQITPAVAAVDAKALKAALLAVYDHSFGPYGWAAMHGVYPVFGSLFTFAAVALPFARAPRRLWGLFAATATGVVVWYLISYQERYLQTLLPWMVAFVAAVASLVWRAGLGPRLGFAALAGLQIVWGGDAFTLPSHTMTGVAPLQTAMQTLVTGYQKNYQGRLQPFKAFYDVGTSLPPDAKVLLHHTHLRLGLRRQTVTDWLPVVLGLNYGRLGSPEAAYAQLRAWGVTHLFWHGTSTDASDSLAGDLVFWTLALRNAVGPKTFSGYTVAALPPEPPAPRGDDVLFVGCGKTYQTGVYPLRDLAVPAPLARPPAPVYPAPREALPDLTAKTAQPHADLVSYVVVETACNPGPRFEGFQSLVTRADGFVLFAR